MASERVNVRPAVQWFAEQMELALRRNDHKGGWDDCDDYWLHERLLEEAAELKEALPALFGSDAGWAEGAPAVVGEAADVANFAMMIAAHRRPIGWSPDGDGE